MTPFSEMGLSDTMREAIAGLGYEEPTPVQSAAIPPLLEGRNVLAQAQTGTGKTAAFGIPMVERIRTEDRHPQALILAPTRELAMQVASAIYDIGHNRGVRVLAVYGGQPIDRQLRGLRAGVHVVVGTPGRIMDHIRRGTLNLEHVHYLVLDEADQMLDMGFIEDVEFILEQLPEERQTGLFSATIPPRIASIVDRHLESPVHITTEKEKLAVPNIRQIAYMVPGRAKSEALMRLLDALAPPSAMVFCRTRRDVDELAERLQIQGYPAEGIHGDMGQAERERVLMRFRDGTTEILVATDVAARGLDIPDVTHVFNFDLPTDPEQYVHRIGRTGRAGRAGEAVSLVAPRERQLLGLIERTSGKRVRMEKLPSQEDVVARRWETFRESLRLVLDDNHLDAYRELAEEMSADYDALDIAAAAMKRLHATERAMAETPMLEEWERAEPAPAEPEAGMARLSLNIGRLEGVRPQDIVGMIANESGVPGRRIGAIEITERRTFVDVPANMAERVARALEHLIFRGRDLHVSRERPGREAPYRPKRGGWSPREGRAPSDHRRGYGRSEPFPYQRGRRRD